MIVIKLKGGLGNQLFQYAIARALSLEKNKSLRIDRTAYQYSKDRKFDLFNFSIDLNFYKKQTNFYFKLKNKIISEIYIEKKFGFQPEIFNIKNKQILLEGYFQSEKYFKKYRDVILNDLKISAPIKKQTKDFLEQIKNQNSVSIHFRRGDYLLKENEIHNTDKTKYYESAIKYIESKIETPIYYIFSDDIDWVKQTFKTNFKSYFIDFNNDETNYEDLLLMSVCKHNIIANSSFSWWGAWMNRNDEKIVIAPKQWFNNNEDYSDVVPEDWVKI